MMEWLVLTFQQLLSRSLMALPVMAAVVLLRWLLRRAPKKYAYVLWSAVGFRLLCPVGLGAILPWSLFNLRPLDTVVQTADAVSAWTGSVPASPAVSAPGSGADAVLSAEAALSAPGLAMTAAAAVWLAGMALIALSGVVSVLRLRRTLATAVLQEAGVYEQEGLPTPFVLGVLRPRIYLPPHLTEEERTYVLGHERHHLKRGDPWWKLLAFGLRAIYWWNPAVWLCAVLFDRDMEMSCDEAVLETLGSQAKKGYSLSLVSFAARRRFPAATPLAFGETDAKSRVRHVLGWKQASPRIAFLAVTAVLLALAICCSNGGHRSWVQVTGGSSGVSITGRLSQPITAWALYQDLYENGTLRSSEPVVTADLESSGSLEGTLTIQQGGGFTGQMACTYTSGDTTTDWTIKLPKASYTGVGSFANKTAEQTRRYGLEEAQEVLLYSVVLSTKEDGGVISQHQELGVVGANDTVVQFRLVTSTGESKDFSATAVAGDLAERLFALRNPYVGNAAADGALLSALGVGEIGAYTMELFTATRPYTLQVNFTDEPMDIDPTSPTIDRTMTRDGTVLLALIDNLEQVNWSYPSREDGQEVHVTMYLERDQPDAWAVNLGYADIKAVGQTAVKASTPRGTRMALTGTMKRCLR